MTGGSTLACLLALGASVLGCSSNSASPSPKNDASTDTTASDVLEEVGEEVGTMEASSDAGPDGPGDAGSDAAADSGRRDMGPDGNTDGEGAEAGLAQPIVIANDAITATAIASDGVHVFWIDSTPGDAGKPNGRVMSVPVGGGTEVTLATKPGATPLGLAVDSANVYWTASDGSLSQLAKTGGTVTALANGVGAPVFASGGFVFYAPSGGGVSKVPVNGGTSSQLSATGAPADLVTVAGNVYWAETSGTISFVPASAGGTPATLVKPGLDAGSDEFVSNTSNQNLTTDGITLFWNRYPGTYAGAVMSIPVNGVAPQVVLNLGQETPFSVASDGTNVYFVDVGSSTTIASVPVTGGVRTTVSSMNTSAAYVANAPGPTVAVDSTNLYWLNPPALVQLAK